MACVGGGGKGYSAAGGSSIPAARGNRVCTHGCLNVCANFGCAILGCDAVTETYREPRASSTDRKLQLAVSCLRTGRMCACVTSSLSAIPCIVQSRNHP